MQQGGGEIPPVLQQAFQKMLGTDTSGLTQAGNQAGQLYGGLVPQAQQAGQSLMGAGQQGLQQAGALNQAGNQVFQTSLDPQNALRDKLMNEVGQASRLATGQRGIGMSPLSAGMETQAKGNFGLDWENAQLQRQIAGLGGMAGASNASANQGAQATRSIGAGMGFNEAAPGYALNAGQVPFQTQNMASQLPFTASSLYSQGLGGLGQNLSGVMGQIIPYLNQGLGATGQAFKQGQTNIGNLAQGFNSLSQNPWLKNAFGPGCVFGGGGYGDPNSMYYGAGGGGGDTTYGPS
jgi:hypothetical protein